MNAAIRVKFNIRGTRYETYESTLQRYPNTLLGNLNARQHFYDYKRGEYYFNCKTELFDSILFFYQTGILAKPCFNSHSEYQEILLFFGILKRKEPPAEATDRRSKLWRFLERPQLSTSSLIYAYVSLLVIVASVASLCIETVVEGMRPMDYRFGTYWFFIECFFISYFTVEYVMRMYAAPSRLQFARSLLGIIDISAIVPFYFGFIIMSFSKTVTIHSIGIIRVMRLIQIFRIVKLSRYSSGMRILGLSLYNCKEQMFSLAAFFMIGVTFSASVVYILEDINDTGMFEDIPSTMWFSVISMTTVGYGDYYPKSVPGKLASVVSIFIGTVILFYLFLPIYLMYFTIFYTNARRQSAEENKAREKANQKKKALIEKEKVEEALIKKEVQNRRTSLTQFSGSRRQSYKRALDLVEEAQRKSSSNSIRIQSEAY